MSQQRNPNEDVILFFAVLFILGLICYVLWTVFHAQLTEVVRWIRWSELWVAKVLVGDGYSIRNNEGLPVLTVAQWRDWLRAAPVQNIAPEFIKTVTMLAVPPMRPVFLVAYAGMSLYVIFFGANARFRRRMDLEGLMREQARSFPAIQPLLSLDPRMAPSRAPGDPVPAQLPLFAEAFSPEEWVVYHEIPYAAGKLDRQKTWAALTLQLGRRWEGPEKLPLHMQGLYATFALKAARKRKDCEALLNDLSRSWTADKGFKPSSKVKAQIKKVLKDPKLGGALKEYTDRHAWETTAMLRALLRARQEGGVLAPAEFLWLRGVDRTLWYPLNNLGRKSFHVEASGAMVHFTNELIANQKIPTPRFEAVLSVLEGFLKSTSARGLPPLDKKAVAPAYWKQKKKKKK